MSSLFPSPSVHLPHLPEQDFLRFRRVTSAGVWVPVVAGLLFSSTLQLPADTHAYMLAAAIDWSSGLPSLH
jgi:hypothetical protein